MNIRRTLIASPRRSVGVLLLLVLVLSACGGATSESWAGIRANPQDGTIYVSFNRHVVALNPASGAIVWEYGGDKGDSFFATPTLADDTLYVGDYHGRLHALSTDGEVQWIYEPARETLIGPLSLTPTDRIIGAATVGPKYVYVGLGSRNLVAVDRQDGTEAWLFETDHGVWTEPLYIPADEEAGTSATLYFASLDHHLYALDPESGELLWKVDLGGAVPGNLVYDAERGRIYAGTFVSELVAVDVNTQRVSARFQADDWLWGAPVLDGDVLYFGDLAGNLYAVQVSDEGFAQLWKRPLSEEAIRAAPVLSDGLLIVGSKDGRLYAVHKEDGSDAWDAPTKGAVLSDLVFIPEDNTNSDIPALVIVGTDDAKHLVMAFDAANGESRWEYADD